LRITIVSFDGLRVEEKAKVTVIEGDINFWSCDNGELEIFDKETKETRSYKWDMLRILADEKLGRL